VAKKQWAVAIDEKRRELRVQHHMRPWQIDSEAAITEPHDPPMALDCPRKPTHSGTKKQGRTLRLLSTRSTYEGNP
jgi:hypothetical protein